jgi:hypothetical protein
MSDAISDTPENIERVIGEAITARSISIDFFSGVGPADLCCITKQFVRAWLPYSAGAECLPAGYYHWCQGADVSCPAAISACVNPQPLDSLFFFNLGADTFRVWW